MSHVDSGPLATYTSLQDKHLVGYFNNTRMKRHLRRAGLVTRRGELVTESTYRLNMARKEHQKHVRDLMAQAIVHKTLDLERQRQSEIKQKLEEIAKVELVRRVRLDRRKGDEDITQYLSPRSGGRPKSAYNQSRHPQPPGGGRPATAPSRRRPSSKRAGVIYVDQDGFPVHRESPRSDTSLDGEVDSPALRELDPKILQRISLNLKPDEREGLSPYSPDVTPRPPPSRSKGQGSPRNKSAGVVSKNGRGYRPRSNKGSLALHRREPAYPHPTQLQTMCDVTVRYRGTGLKLQYEREDKRDEIQVYQQHCGGENLIVFSGHAEKGNDLIFVSRRHRGYPFSVTFFVNRVQVLRLSACCEYKYTPGALLGGSKGHFKFISVHGSSPCYRCLVEAEFARRERQRYKDVQTEPVLPPPPEPEPEKAGMSTQTEALEEEEEESKREASTQKEDEEEEKDAEAGYDEDFEEDDDDEDEKASGNEAQEEDDKQSFTSQTKDDFFSDADSEKYEETDKKAEGDYNGSDSEMESEQEEQDDKPKEVEEDDEIPEEDDQEKESRRYSTSSSRDDDDSVKEESDKNSQKEWRAMATVESSEEEDEEVENEENVGDEMVQEDEDDIKEEKVKEDLQEEEGHEEQEEKKDREKEKNLFSASEGEYRLLSSDDEGHHNAKTFQGRAKEPASSEAEFKISSSAEEDEMEDDEDTKKPVGETGKGFLEAEFKISSSGEEDEKDEQDEIKRVDNETESEPEDKDDKSYSATAEDAGSGRDDKEKEDLDDTLTEHAAIEPEVEAPQQEAVLIKEAVLVHTDDDSASLAEEHVLATDDLAALPATEDRVVESDHETDSKRENDANDGGSSHGGVSEAQRRSEDKDQSKDDSESVQHEDEVDNRESVNETVGAEQTEDTPMQQSTKSDEDQHSVVSDSPDVKEDSPVQQSTKYEEDESYSRVAEKEVDSAAESAADDESQRDSVVEEHHEEVTPQVQDDAETSEKAAESEEETGQGQKEEETEPDIVIENGNYDKSSDQEKEENEGAREQDSTPDEVEPKENEHIQQQAMDAGDEEKTRDEEQSKKDGVDEKEEVAEKKDEDDEKKGDEDKKKWYESDHESSSSSSSDSSSDSEDEKEEIKLSGYIQEKSDNPSRSQLALSMNEKNLDSDKAQQIAKALLEDPKYKSVEYLLLRCNPMEDEGVSSIMQSLIALHKQAPDHSSNSKNENDPANTGIKLTHLDLGDTKMSIRGAQDVGEFLKLPTNLQNINLSDNQIGRAGCKAIAAGLRANKSLWTLSIEYAGLGDGGCREIIEAVRDHPTLKELNIEGNDISDESARAILQLVKDNSVLTTINFVRDNEVSQELAEEIQEILKTGEFIW